MRPAAVRSRLVAVATVLTVALTGCTGTTPTLAAIPAATATAPGGFARGADGIGDAYFPTAGNGGYDVADYGLDVMYDPASQELHGRATIAATATGNLTSFNLDFTGLGITSITVNDTPAQWRQGDGELTVTPAAPLAAGSEFTTVVVYGGHPQPYADPALGQTGFLISDDGAVAIGEPQVAASWFPVNDHPRDKATYTIRISAPAGLAVLSNGVLVSQEEDPDRAGYTRWTWRVSSPMAPYLATMVVGHYRVHSSTHDGLPVMVAVDSDLPSTIDDQLARTPEIVDYLETVFGPYPFDAMGGIAIDDQRVSFALENQTRPVYAGGFFRNEASWVIAHELAHQWFGDSVSVHDWSEIWLNEGFATYAEWLWAEHTGTGTAAETFRRLYGSFRSEFWQLPPAAPGREHLFDGEVYVRGAMTLHALRVTVGDDAFFRILQEWAKRKKDSTATTAEFEALAEEISGRDLHTLFQDWLYGTTRPPRP